MISMCCFLSIAVCLVVPFPHTYFMLITITLMDCIVPLNI